MEANTADQKEFERLNNDVSYYHDKWTWTGDELYKHQYEEAKRKLAEFEERRSANKR